MLHKSLTRQKLVIKFMFLFSYMAAAAWLSYFYVYLKEVPQLTIFEIGIIAGFQQFNNIFVVPTWGLLSDKFGRKRMLLFSMGITVFLIPCFLIFDGFIALAIFMTVVTLFYNPMVSLFDTVALDYEEQSKGETSYGEIRLWASIGWGSSSFLTGLLINKIGLSYIFPVSALFFFVVWILLFFFYKPLTTKTHLSTLRPTVIHDLLKTEQKLLYFFLLILVYSVFAAPIFLIINVYYHELGAPSSIIGLAFAVQAISEIPFFFYGKRLVARFGAKKIFLFTMIATAIRMLLYGINVKPELAVCIGIIHGISIGLFFVSMVAFVHNIVPSQMRSTGQSLIYSFYAGGVAVGNVMIGLLDEFISIKNTMLINGTVVLFLVLMVLIFGPRVKFKTEK